MGEFLPIFFGGVVAALTLLIPPRVRAFAFPMACVLAGAAASAINGEAASAINGELASKGWLFFLSLDSLLVWFAAMVSFSAAWWLRRQHAVS